MNNIRFSVVILLVIMGASFWVVSAQAQEPAIDPAAPDTVFIGPAGSAQTGQSVSIVGDFNGDGYADVAIGAPNYDGPAGTDSGAVFLFLGSPAGWAGQLNLANSGAIRFDGVSAGDEAGFSVAGAGDVNNDGFADIVIGARTAGVGGEAYLVLGHDTPTSISLGDPAVTNYFAPADEQAGWSVAGAGDFNGDGYDDFLIGAPGDFLLQTGKAYLVFGGLAPFPGDLTLVALSLDGVALSSGTGFSVAGAGDVNADGYADILIGAPEANNGEGEAYLVLGEFAPSGGSLGSIADSVFTGGANYQVGVKVAAAGDVNGDGFADILISAPGFNNDRGRVSLVVGPPPAGINSLIISPAFVGAFDGQQVQGGQGVGDLNGDGFDDFLFQGLVPECGGCSAIFTAYGGRVFNGGITDSLSPLTSLTVDFRGEISGGDVNGDGIADVIAGTPTLQVGGAFVGGAHLFLSDPAGAGSPPLRQQRTLLGNSGTALPVVFDQAGVQIEIPAGAAVDGGYQVARHFYHPCQVDRRLTMPIWEISTNKFPAGGAAVLTFKYNDGQVLGLDEANLKIWRRPATQPCGDWEILPGTPVVATGTNRIGIAVTGSLNYQYTISEGPPSPTAITNTEISAAPLSGMGWLALVLPLLTLTGARLWLQRGESPRPGHSPNQPLNR